MASTARRVSVTTSAQLLNSSSTDGVAGQSILVRPVGGDVYIGGSGVTSAAGFLLSDGESMTQDGFSADGIYAITASGTVTVHVFESGL